MADNCMYVQYGFKRTATATKLSASSIFLYTVCMYTWLYYSAIPLSQTFNLQPAYILVNKCKYSYDRNENALDKGKIQIPCSYALEAKIA